MSQTRRTFLLGAATVAALGTGGYATRASLMETRFAPRPLDVPPLLDARMEGQSMICRWCSRTASSRMAA